MTRAGHAQVQLFLVFVVLKQTVSLYQPDTKEALHEAMSSLPISWRYELPSSIVRENLSSHDEAFYQKVYPEVGHLLLYVWNFHLFSERVGM